MARALSMAFAVVLAACSHDEGPPSGSAPEAVPASAPALVPVPMPVPAPAAPAPAAVSHDSTPRCGDYPQPPCPLKAWMKANTAPAINAHDFARLIAALEKVADLAPAAGYPNWASIANDGASAARVQDLEAVRAACRGCHTQYRDRYKLELRDRPVGG